MICFSVPRVHLADSKEHPSPSPLCLPASLFQMNSWYIFQADPELLEFRYQTISLLDLPVHLRVKVPAAVRKEEQFF